MVTLSPEGLARLGRELANVDRLLADLAPKAIAVAEAELRADVGADQTMSRYKGGGVRMTVEAKVAGATLQLTGAPSGPWVLLEKGSNKQSWRITGRDGGPVAFGGVVRESVRHGPVRGKGTFTRAAVRIDADAARWADEYVDRLIARAG